VNRREVITLIAGATTAPVLLWPSLARAQLPPGKPPTIGYLGATTPQVERRQLEAFVQRLRDHGWIEARNVAIEQRWVEGRAERAAELANELARLKVDVIVTWGTANIVAATQATASIPVVFAAAADPVGTGLVASLARPGGNLTGLSIQAVDLAAKRLELLREVVPDLRRLAIMAHVGGPGATLEMAEVQATSRALGVESASLELQRAENIEPAIAGLRGRAEALYVCVDPLVNTHRIRINMLAQAARLPTMYGQRLYVEAGGLVSYGPNIPDLFRRTADLVDKILRGARAASIPVEQPSRFELIVNLKTAKAIGLAMPRALIALADEVIE